MSDLELTAGIFLTAERFLWHGPSKTAVLADVHLGIEETLFNAGIFIPEVFDAVIRRQWEALAARGPARVVIAGDSFDRSVPDGKAVRVYRELLALLPLNCAVTVLAGNHDPLFEELRKATGAQAVELEAREGEILISHGHALPAHREGWETWVVGHQHPAVTLRTPLHRAKMTCYAMCAFMLGGRRRKLIMLPAFSGVSLGCNLLEERQWMLPVKRPGNGEIRIAGIVERAHGDAGQVLDFGMLSGLAGSV